MKMLIVLSALLLALSSCTKNMPAPYPAPDFDPVYVSDPDPTPDTPPDDNDGNDNGDDNGNDNGDDNGNNNDDPPASCSNIHHAVIQHR
jgi:hypothetical protein